MYIIIVGAGKLGYYLAELLLEEEHDPVVIDFDAAVCKKLASELDIPAIHGDGTEPSMLEKAGIKEADAVVALTASDETNMVISLLAKDLGAKRVACRIEKVHYDERILKKIGIDIVIHPEAAAAGYIEELITKPGVLDLAYISRGAAEIMEIQLKATSKIAGKKIKEVERPAGSAIIALYEDDKLVIPELNTKIKPDSKILVLAKRDIADKVRKMFV